MDNNHRDILSSQDKVNKFIIPRHVTLDRMVTVTPMVLIVLCKECMYLNSSHNLCLLLISNNDHRRNSNPVQVRHRSSNNTCLSTLLSMVNSLIMYSLLNISSQFSVRMVNLFIFVLKEIRPIPMIK
jgi:hypothetical protein